MIRISEEPWQVMVDHARQTYPRECCGVMLGTVPTDGSEKQVVRAVPVENAYEGGQEDRYEIRPTDLLKVEREARAAGLSVVGIYPSHPDCGAYFSKTDLQNSCPWYSFVVISIVKGDYNEANCFLPNADCTQADAEELIVPALSASTSADRSGVNSGKEQD